MDLATSTTSPLIEGDRSNGAPPFELDDAGARSQPCDLDEALRLSRRLVDRARHFDELRSQHGLDLPGFEGAFAPLFEDVERAVEGLVRTRLPADPDPSLEGDLR